MVCGVLVVDDVFGDDEDDIELFLIKGGFASQFESKWLLILYNGTLLEQIGQQLNLEVLELVFAGFLFGSPSAFKYRFIEQTESTKIKA